MIWSISVFRILNQMIMQVKHPITTFEDIKNLVDTFYSNVREDDLIGPIFTRVIQDRWDEHLGKMYKFWETVLFDDVYTYKGRPFPPHIPLGLEQTHFNRWITIFDRTIDELFVDDETSEKAKKQAKTMAMLFQSKLEYFSQEGRKPIV